MTLEQLIVTTEDIAYIIDSRIIQEFFTMYKGFSATDIAGYRHRQERLSKDYMAILKAFFVPSYVLTDTPNDSEAMTMLRDAAMVRDDSNREWKKKTNIAKALSEAQTQMFRFRSIPKEQFEVMLRATGYSRKLNILVDYFEIPKDIIVNGLFTLCQVNNNGQEIFRKQQPEKEGEQPQVHEPTRV